MNIFEKLTTLVGYTVDHIDSFTKKPETIIKNINNSNMSLSKKDNIYMNNSMSKKDFLRILNSSEYLYKTYEKSTRSGKHSGNDLMAIDSTAGEFSSLPDTEKLAISNMFSQVSQLLQKGKYKDTIFNLYYDLCTIHINSSTKWNSYFRSLSRLANEEKGNNYFYRASYLQQYVLQIYTIKLLTVLFPAYITYCDKCGDDINKMHKMFAHDYQSMMKHLILVSASITNKFKREKRNPVKVLKEYIKTYNTLLKEFDINKKHSAEELDESFSEEVLGFIAGAIASVIIFSIFAKDALYYVNCVSIDISKSLVEQAAIIVANTKRLESERDKYTEDDPEYQRYDNMIKSQRSYAETALAIANALNKDDVVSISKIENYVKSEPEDTIDDPSDDDYGEIEI